MTDQIKVTINEREFEIDKGSRLIDVCREKGFGIPSFCYYKDLELQASCRMCLVRIEKMPKLQTSCTIICTDGMVVTTQSEEVEKAQRAMGEFLLANHPLDCPVCDRGGECELQEVIFDWGDVEERFSEKKNIQPEKYLSPIVANDPQRCILCKRCTRVCHEWMDEDAIEAGNRGASTVIGTYGGWLNCSQCGNCIEVCPTGTLLDGVYRHETRPWELDQTISTDVYGSDGMQISIGSRGGKVHRIVARDRYVNGLNGEFLDVKARFAHEFIDHADRIKTPMIRYSKGGKLIPATWDAATKFAADKLKEHGNSVGVIASPRLTNESIFALKKFADEVVKTDNFGISDRQPMNFFFANLSAPLATHKELLYAKSIIVCGGDPDEEQTFTAKQIRQAVRNNKANLIVINETPIRLTRMAKQFIHVNQGAINVWPVGGLHENLEKFGVTQPELDALNNSITETEGDVVFVVGSDLAPEVQAALASLASTFVGNGRRILLHPLPLYNNSVGAIDIASNAKSVNDVVKSSRALLIGGSLQDASMLAGKDFIAVQELFLTETTDHADVVFPAASFAEVDGTFTNNAGNVQRVRKAIEPLHQSKPDWMITAQLAREVGVDLGFAGSASAVFKAVTEAVPAYADLRYPDLKDESKPVRAKHALSSNAVDTEALKKLADAIPEGGTKNSEIPKIGHKLHRLTTMTSKTAQFHLLAHGNPKPENLLVSPLVQFGLDGISREEGKAEAATVNASDRSAPVKII